MAKAAPPPPTEPLRLHVAEGGESEYSDYAPGIEESVERRLLPIRNVLHWYPQVFGGPKACDLAVISYSQRPC